VPASSKVPRKAVDRIERDINMVTPEFMKGGVCPNGI